MSAEIYVANIPADVRQAVEYAIKLFLKKDSDLLYKNVNERSISHKIAEHLQKYFPDYKVDCEYNHNGDAVKRLGIPTTRIDTDEVNAITVYPDIVIHKRGSKENLLIIEIKKTKSNYNYDLDLEKLKAFTSDYEYQYKFGLFLLINVKKQSITEKIWFRGGLIADDSEKTHKFSNPTGS
jgi:hypothetical protein